MKLNSKKKRAEAMYDDRDAASHDRKDRNINFKTQIIVHSLLFFSNPTMFQ